MKKDKRLKICLAASAGGHLNQLLKLANCWNGHNVFFVTTSDIVREKISNYGKVYSVGESNRRHIFRLLWVFILSLKIVFIEKPNVVISTGAAVGCILCMLAKIRGAKIIWIDSITNIERLSLSGRLVRPVADLFLAQWQPLTEQYTKVNYAGTLI